MEKIRVTPLASESLGTRSMATLVETPDLKVLIDPGVSLGPRFRLLPHPQEYKVRDESRERIVYAAEEADLITVSHYHYDHYTPTFVDTVWIGSSPEEAQRIFKGKRLLVKDTRNTINFSQRRRGWIFQRTVKDYVKGFDAADGRVFEFGGTKLRFSEPVSHGEEDSMLGWVLMLTVEVEGEKFTHASDVQGPISEKALKLILAEKPRLVMVGGPPLYLAGFRVNEASLTCGLEHLKRLVEAVPVTIVDHHLLRDEEWRAWLSPVFKVAEKVEHKVVTAAEFLGVENHLLESKRRRLYEEDPPSEEFSKWMRLAREKQKSIPPPI